MQLVFLGDEFPISFTQSVYLGGSDSEEEGITKWRQDALDMLSANQYDGVVFVPEYKDGSGVLVHDQRFQEFNWQQEAIDMSDVIVYWIPRVFFPKRQVPEPWKGRQMVGLDANTEFGTLAKTGKVVFGTPDWCDWVSYQWRTAEKYDLDRSTELEKVIQFAIGRMPTGAERIGGERYVPLHLWYEDMFQQWYEDGKLQEIELARVEVLWFQKQGNNSFFGLKVELTDGYKRIVSFTPERVEVHWG